MGHTVMVGTTAGRFVAVDKDRLVEIYQAQWGENRQRVDLAALGALAGRTPTGGRMLSAGTPVQVERNTFYDGAGCFGFVCDPVETHPDRFWVLMDYDGETHAYPLRVLTPVSTALWARAHHGVGADPDYVYAGMGATVCIGNDRYPYTVLRTTVSGSVVVLQQDRAFLIKGNAQRNDAEYYFMRNAEGPTLRVQRSRVKGRWMLPHRGGTVRIGVRQHRLDPSG